MAAASGYPIATAGVCIGHPNRLMSDRFLVGFQCYYGRVSMRLKNWRLVRSGSKMPAGPVGGTAPDCVRQFLCKPRPSGAKKHTLQHRPAAGQNLVRADGRIAPTRCDRPRVRDFSENRSKPPESKPPSQVTPH